MSNLQLKQQNKLNYSNISITAYRAIKILKLLMDSPRSNAEIIEILKNYEITSKSVSDDTIRMSINSLKSVGCVIARPCQANGYKYVLTSHPFKISITKQQIKILLKLRQYFLNKNDWKKVLDINRLYDKIIYLVNNDDITDLLSYNKPFIRVRQDILDILEKEDLKKKEIVLTYNTSSKKTEIINIRSEYVFCEAERLYIMGWYYKRNNYAYFNVEKISEIHSIKPTNTNSASLPEEQKVLYKVSGYSLKMFTPLEDETIILQNKKHILVEAVMRSEFKTIQRLLSFGSDFELIEHAELKQKIAEKLKKMRAGYE